MEVKVKQVEGLALIAKGETNHWVAMDSPGEEFGGQKGASSPVELLLMAVGGCTLMDVISILTRMKVSFDKVEAKVSGDRNEDHPKSVKKIHIHYIIYGKDVPKDKVERAIALSQDKYCSVKATISQAVTFIHDYEIVA